MLVKLFHQGGASSPSRHLSKRLPLSDLLLILKVWATGLLLAVCLDLEIISLLKWLGSTA